MNQLTIDSKKITVCVLAISCLVVLISFLCQGNKGFSLADEGFLWYGVQRVMFGEVPILDFMAYDPGRYYWSAALLSIVGDNSIMSLRAAVAVFQTLGLFTGLLLIAHSGKSDVKCGVPFLIMSAVILALWMIPRHKLFDISISIFLIGVLTYLITNPTPKRYFTAGVCVGLIAVFGRNHGLYGALASLGIIAWLNIKTRSAAELLRKILIWGVGIVIGFLPIIFMAILIPGFALAFWQSILFLFELNATNLPLPVPWPWNAARDIVIGIFFIGILVFGGVSVLWVVYRKLQEKPIPPALVGSAFLALPYAHYAFSRADVGHLALGIFPLLIGCLVILSTAKASIKWPLAVLLCATSFSVTLSSHAGLKCLGRKKCVNIEIAGSQLQIDPDTARDIALLRQLADQYAPNGRAFIVTPNWPGAYALTERKSPMWEIYALFHRSEAFQRKEIDRIEASKPGFAFVLNMPLDGRDELRFENTHRLVHQYILQNFEPISVSQNPAYEIYKAKSEKE